MVTPCVGVWIEIELDFDGQRCFPSLPAWECGLKLMMAVLVRISLKGHSLRGSVD